MLLRVPPASSASCTACETVAAMEADSLKVHGNQILAYPVMLGSNCRFGRNFSEIGGSRAFGRPSRVGMPGMCTLLGWHSLAIKLFGISNPIK